MQDCSQCGWIPARKNVRVGRCVSPKLLEFVTSCFSSCLSRLQDVGAKNLSTQQCDGQCQKILGFRLTADARGVIIRARPSAAVGENIRTSPW